MYKDSKIYVSGHTGLIGSALMGKLKEHGYCHVISRSHAELDLTDKGTVFEFFSSEKPEYVFLAAGKVGGILSNKICLADYLHINISIQDNVFEAAQKYNVRHLIFYGSSCSYPKDCEQPIKEEYFFKLFLWERRKSRSSTYLLPTIYCQLSSDQDWKD